MCRLALDQSRAFTYPIASRLPAMRKIQTIVQIMVTAAVAVGTSIIGSAPAQAVRCYGDYCSGQDPTRSGCGADAYVATVKNVSIGSLQTRYSPTCKTNWAKLVIYSTGNRCVRGGSLAALQDTGYRQSSETQTVCGTRSETTFWTPMIYSPTHKVKAQFQSFGSFTEVVETPWA